MRIAAIQMTSTPDKSHNLAEAHRLLREALEKKPEIVAFPENSLLFCDKADDWRAGAETLTGVMASTLQEWAADYGVHIVGGSIPLKVSGKKKITNTSLVIDPQGEIVARYDKIHLFDADLGGDKTRYLESDLVQAGKKPVIAKTSLVDFGLGICYDLRFPELFRKYSEKDVPAVFLPTAFTALTGKAHWDALTRARAIENQFYLIAPCQWGEHYPGRHTHGHTRIVDPWGRIIAERPAGPGVIWADLSNDELNRVRREIPCLSNRKLK